MKGKKYLVMTVALAVCLGMAGCGTTLGSNTKQYFSQVSARLATMAKSGKAGSSATKADDGKTALNTPGNLTVSTDGDFSFDGVENAEYYVLYMYDAKAEEGVGYLYASSNIEEDGSASYSGSLKDSITYPYGDYRIEAVAYPSITDAANKKSEAATCEIVVSGEVAEPTFAYMWDYFSKTLHVQLINIESYKNTAFPTTVKIQLENKANASDKIVLEIKDLSLEEDVYYASTTEVSLD